MPFDRRTFLQTGSACAASLALVPFGSSEEASFVDFTGRKVQSLNQRWLFSPRAENAMRTREYDDSAFEQVSLPHTNISLPWHGFDQSRYQFVSMYRRRLNLPAGLTGKRLFVDFEGAMTKSTLWCNGTRVGDYQGGYTPFSFELTHLLDPKGENMLAVEVDSRELPGIPPFGYEIDFLTFGGIYREVSLRIVPVVYIENIFVRAGGLYHNTAALDATVYLDQTEAQPGSLQIELALLDAEKTIASVTRSFSSATKAGEPVAYDLSLGRVAGVSAWDLEAPRLYTVRVRLIAGGAIVDEDKRTVGFRTASFTKRGFELNGRVVKLRGLNRHQTFPYVGGAMPARVQRRDAQILKDGLKCNIVRTSHYPQSRHFLDACDELGLLVLEEIPGWQHVGDEAWQDLAVDNVRRMIRRDWNHPSIVLWSIRINESRDFHDFYVRTNAVAHALDSTRQTLGVRYFQESECLEDVFGMNDFQFPLKAPNHVSYLNTEFVGAEWPVRASDNNAIHREHVLRYARIYNQLQSDAAYAGGLGWCAFDYNTHADFGGGDHVCYMGVMDIFREPKAAAGFYRSQCDPSEAVVLEPAFHFAENDGPGDFKDEVICSNCDKIAVSIRPLGSTAAFHPVVELQPAHDRFPYLNHPPFFLSLPNGNDDWGDLRLEGFVNGTKVVTRTLSGEGAVRRLELTADDETLRADGSDATRIVLRVTDEYGNTQRLASDPIVLSISGPGTFVGPPIVALSGGSTAVWVRTQQQEGRVIVSATHDLLETKTVSLRVADISKELI